jgi:hypothetical protein
MRKRGIMYVCDRCGKQIFAEELKVGECDQRGLSEWGLGMKRYHAAKDLCPKCFEEYREYDRHFCERNREET